VCQKTLWDGESTSITLDPTASGMASITQPAVREISDDAWKDTARPPINQTNQSRQIEREQTEAINQFEFR
jgi:hypothetical protein